MDTVLKQIQMPVGLLNLVEAKLDPLNIKFTDYVRTLIINDTEALKQNLPVQILNEDEMHKIRAALADVKAGKVYKLPGKDTFSKEVNALLKTEKSK